MYNDNDNVRKHQELLNKRFNDDLPKWKVFYFATYWTRERTIIIKACVGYDQTIEIKEIIQKSKLSIEDFITYVNKLVLNTKKVLVKGECFYGVIFNEHPIIQLILKSFRGYKKLQSIDELQNELEILETLHETNKIRGIEKLAISQKPHLISLLLLINLCQIRLFSKPSKNWIRVHNPRSRQRYGVTVERLPHDKDYYKFMQPPVDCRGGSIRSY